MSILSLGCVQLMCAVSALPACLSTSTMFRCAEVWLLANNREVALLLSERHYWAASLVVADLFSGM